MRADQRLSICQHISRGAARECSTMTDLVSSDQESDQLITDVLGRQTLTRDMVPSVEQSIQEIVRSLSAILSLFHQLGITQLD